MFVTDSAHDFSTTVENARTAIESRGLTLLAEIDHSANAERVEMALRPTTLFVFGNPRVGTRVMEARQSAGIDLPLKLLIWQDEQGKVRVAYNDPAWIFDRHDVRDKEEILETMTGALRDIAAEATANSDGGDHSRESPPQQ